MLENLINTKLKRKLLNFFFAQPKRSYHVNELRIMTGNPGSNISQVLRELARVQIVNQAVKRKKSYFRINPYFPFYEELEDLVQDQKLEQEDEVSRFLKRIPNAKLIILSGIFTHQIRLEIDLLLVGEKINRVRTSQIIGELEDLMGQEINYVIMDPQEYDYRRLLSDKLIRDVLDNPHLVVYNTLK